MVSYKFFKIIVAFLGSNFKSYRLIFWSNFKLNGNLASFGIFIPF